ncbi:DUF1444 family protein [Myroides marinus]|uniref:DUF1444 family protein n=1 Tax=Myroides marinus TaxID=703342 RepID=UPI002575A991|nr:DUF1444 family protein [Myroides marinus]MDM1404947.1 DUF1444 family protein [Myroides marinus]
MGIFSKLFGNKQHQVTSSTTSKNTNKQQKNDLSCLYPQIRSTVDSSFIEDITNSDVLTENFVDGLVICYVLDNGEGFEQLTKRHLIEYGVEFEEVRKIAYQNLRQRFKKHSQVGEFELDGEEMDRAPFYTINFDDNLNASVMLIEPFWRIDATSTVNSDLIAISIPAMDICLFTNFREQEDFNLMRGMGQGAYITAKSKEREVTEKIYIHKNGEWVLYLDTSEQLGELL